VTSPDGSAAVARARLLVLGAAVLWSLSGLFLKSPVIEGIEPLAARGPLVACWRTLFAALVVAPFVRWRRVRWRWGLLPLMASFAAMNLLFVTAMTCADAGNVIFLQYTAPLWVCLGGWLWLRESTGRAGLGALVLGMAGVAVIGWGARGDAQLAGALLALGAGVAYAGVILALRALHGEDAAWLVFLCFATSWLVTLPWALSFERGLAGDEWLWVGALGVLQMAAAYGLFALGVRHLTAPEASLITLVEPVLNPLWVWLAWGVAIQGYTVAGGALIVLGLALRYRREVRSAG